MTSKIKDIHQGLHDKFAGNLKQSLTKKSSDLEEMEVKARAAYYLGEILFKDTNITDTQREVTKIFHEIFTDFTVASYLSCCVIDNAARIVLRRILELGIATVYLWDLPYKFWNWNNYDDYSNDLNFKEMLDYLNNRGYVDFVNKENGTTLTNLINKESASKPYRELSNVIHGKSITFESLDENSFEYKEDDLSELVEYTKKIENILLSIWKARFPNHFKQLEDKFTPVTKYNYEY